MAYSPLAVEGLVTEAWESLSSDRQDYVRAIIKDPIMTLWFDTQNALLKEHLASVMASGGLNAHDLVSLQAVYAAVRTLIESNMQVGNLLTKEQLANQEEVPAAM